MTPLNGVPHSVTYYLSGSTKKKSKLLANNMHIQLFNVLYVLSTLYTTRRSVEHGTLTALD